MSDYRDFAAAVIWTITHSYNPVNHLNYVFIADLMIAEVPVFIQRIDLGSVVLQRVPGAPTRARDEHIVALRCKPDGHTGRRLIILNEEVPRIRKHAMYE